MIYAVIDTNVFVSAFITHNLNSATRIVVNSVFGGKIVPLYNDEILAEYEEVLSRGYLHIEQSRKEAILNYVREHGVSFERTPFDKLFIDEDDRVFYEVMLSKDDSFLVTGNLKHFPVTPRVVTPAQMIQILNEEQ